MYVKIVKCENDTWYKKHIGVIFPVDEESFVDNQGVKYKYNVLDTNNYIKKSDCEIIDFNPDQISEEMAKKLVCVHWLSDVDRLYLIENWKDAGYINYIKMNRIDEIKKELEELEDVKEESIHYVELLEELIKLHDEEIKKLRENR